MDDENSSIEGKVKNEVKFNSSVISPSQMFKFPYVVLGRVKMTFFSTEEQKEKISEGVGFLIGDNIVLTSAHILYFPPDDFIISIYFLPLVNGSITLIKPVKCYKYFYPKNYIKIRENNLKKNSLMFDFALCFLEGNLGTEIVNTFKLQNDLNLKLHGKLFHYFFYQDYYVENAIKSFKNEGMNEKMALITYQKNDDYNETRDSTFYLRNSTSDRNSVGTNFTNYCNDAISYGEHNDYNYYIISDITKKSEKKLQKNKNVYSFGLTVNEKKGTFFNKFASTQTNYELQYAISTCCGQSGSPLFLRKKNKKVSNYLGFSKFDYILVGIHSRSGDLERSIFSSGVSMYNVGLYLNKSIYNSLLAIINSENYKLYKPIEFSRERHVIISVWFSDEMIFVGVFPEVCPVKKLFEIISEEYFKFDVENIILRCRNKLFSYNNEMMLGEIFVDEKRISFDIIFEEDEYANKVCERIIIKTKENGVKNIEYVFDNILSELNLLGKQNKLLYGNIFKKVSKNVFRRICKNSRNK